MTGELRVALLQHPLAWHDPAANRAAFAERVSPLRGAVDLVVLPEMFTTGFTMDAPRQCEAANGTSVEWLRDRARELDAAVCASIATVDGDCAYNRLSFAMPDGAVVQYDKRHRFRMSGEHEHYAAGGEHTIVDWRGFRILLSVCYDLRFPVWLRNPPPRVPGHYDVLLCVANWPAARQHAWDTLLRARAIENLVYAVGVNRTGTDGNGLAYTGGSAAIGPDGSELVAAASVPGTYHARLERAALDDFREHFPAWRDADPFALRADWPGEAHAPGRTGTNHDETGWSGPTR